MAEFPAVVASIEKGKVVLDSLRGIVLQCEFASGKMPRVGNKGVAVVDEAAKQVRFKGPRGSAYFKVVAGL